MAEEADREGISVPAVVRWVRQFAEVIAANKAYLTDLDSAIGDADHGINMNRGMQAADWNPVPQSPSVSNGLNSVTINISGAHQKFRLRRQ